MLRDNLAGLIEPMLSSVAAHNLGGLPNRENLGNAPGRPSWQSSLLSDPSAKFSDVKSGDRQKNKWPGFKVTTQAHDSRAVRIAQHKSHRTIDPQCLENPRPEGAESTLTGNAASPFPAEPRHGDNCPLLREHQETIRLAFRRADNSSTSVRHAAS